jgi:hypothetical protein
MAYTQSDVGMDCPYCNTGVITQYRSGKFGCDKKCWLNNQARSIQDLPPQQPQPQQPRQPIDHNAEIHAKIANVETLVKAMKVRLDEVIDKFNTELGT